MAKYSKRALMFVLGLVALFIIVIIAAFSRNAVIPAYVSMFYANGVNKTFNVEFNPINSQLHDHGVQMENSKATCHNGISDGGDVDYHYLRATVPCQRSEESNAIHLSPQIIAQLKRSLGESGWKLGPYNLEESPVAVTGLTSEYGGLAYKLSGKTYCVIGYNESDFLNEVTEVCERDVSFFGGDNG